MGGTRVAPEGEDDAADAAERGLAGTIWRGPRVQPLPEPPIVDDGTAFKGLGLSTSQGGGGVGSVQPGEQERGESWNPDESTPRISAGGVVELYIPLKVTPLVLHHRITTTDKQTHTQTHTRTHTQTHTHVVESASSQGAQHARSPYCLARQCQLHAPEGEGPVLWEGKRLTVVARKHGSKRRRATPIARSGRR